MRKPIWSSVAVLLVLGGLYSDAEAQLGRRLGDRLRAAPSPNSTPRNDGQFRQRLENLGGKIQTAIDNGALDALTAKAGENLPALPGSLTGSLAPGGQLKAELSSGNRPFTPAWYADHPKAWHYTHPHADAWAVASIGTVSAWLGIAVAAPASTALGDNVFTSDSVTPPPVEIPAAGDYLSLGVFALGPAGARDPSALLQLAVSKQGELHGNYYDVVTGQELPLSGKLDKQTQLATFKADALSSAEFEVSLVSLTRPEGSARLRFDNGQTQDWTLARFGLPTADAK